MPYIGRGTDKLSNVEVLDNITFDGSSSYTLQKGGSNFTPSSANTLLVSINGVVQAGNFTVSGSTIDIGTAVAGTSTCDFILHYGTGLITTPADGTVTTAKLADSSVSLAKLTATGTKDSTTFLRGDNTFAAAGLNGWSENGANNNLLPASASAGIYLGVNSATASNLLDDYEEGSWTPLLSMGGGSVGYGLNAGAYTKIGRYVFATFAFQLNSVSSPSGAAGITGLPFSGDGSGEEFVNGVYFALVRNLNNSYDNMRGYVMKGTSSISVQVNNTNQNIATLDASNFTSSTLIYGSIGYQTA